MLFLQLSALKRENKILIEKFKETKIGAPIDSCNNGLNNRNEDQASNIDSSNDSCTKSSDEEGIEHFNKTFQAGTIFFSLYLCLLVDMRRLYSHSNQLD